jgi:hypothetical protein
MNDVVGGNSFGQQTMTMRSVVVVSCVTTDPPYRPHPHNLVGKEGCKKGVCTMEISNEEMSCEFSNLGIQCVKKKDIEDSLRVREEIRVDPFRSRFFRKFHLSFWGIFKNCGFFVQRDLDIKRSRGRSTSTAFGCAFKYFSRGRRRDSSRSP